LLRWATLLATIDMGRKVGRGCCFSYFCICDTPLNCYYFTHQSYPFAHLGLTSFRRITKLIIYTVSQKNVPPLACYNFDAHEWILTFFGRNVTDKIGNQKTLYYATSNNLCFCTTWQNAETRNHIFHSIGLCYTHNAPVRYIPERKKLSSVMCLIASNIC